MSEVKKIIAVLDANVLYPAMAEIESYLQKGFSKLTDQEDNRLDELSRSVEAWEIKQYPMPVNPQNIRIDSIFIPPH